MTQNPISKRLLTLSAICLLILAIPLSLRADTRSYTPPPRKGVIFVVIKYKSYSSRDIHRSTNVTITWGNFRRSKNYPSATSMKPKIGVVIRLRHDNKDSVPLTVETDGSILFLNQTTQSPRQWNDSTWEQTDW